jgi:ABC-type antimicrobial peptide transport system permease subunit
MLSWGSILYGAGLSAVAAGALLAIVARPRQPAVILMGVLAAAAGPLAWNAILRATHASQFFTDAPLRLLPASWQDTGSGVFALATTAVLLGVGSLAAAPTRRTIGLAILCGLAAFLVDVYLY